MFAFILLEQGLHVVFVLLVLCFRVIVLPELHIAAVALSYLSLSLPGFSLSLSLSLCADADKPDKEHHRTRPWCSRWCSYMRTGFQDAVRVIIVDVGNKRIGAVKEE